MQIGSLERLGDSAALTLFNMSDPTLRTGSAGEETAAQVIADIPDEGFDLVIMNPPFTRATNHEGAHADITNPAFAAFDATPADQTAMGKRINKLGRGTCYHGNAGIASAFAALADKKLKPGGVLALVLPLSAAAGLSWQKFRQMLADDYTDLTVLTIAAATMMICRFQPIPVWPNALVIARKLKRREQPSPRMHFTSLTRRPQGFAHASAIAGNVASANGVRQVEDGPYGGTPLMVGAELAGQMMTAPNDTESTVWGAVRLSDYSLAQTAHALFHSSYGCRAGRQHLS